MPPIMRRLDDPFFPVTPAQEFTLPRDSGHSIAVETAGNPDGMPVIVCHGGPGGSNAPSRRRFFNPEHFRIVQFDQRGCGRSTPTGLLEANSLQHTIADMEAIRAHLGIEKWVVSGGSWGSVVAIAYAETHPERCLGLNLTCTWLCRKKDIDWWFHGVRSMFPELWEAFAAPIPANERHDLRTAYAKRILGNDPDIADTLADNLFLYEQGFMAFDSILEEPAPGRGARYGRIFAHYASNNFFVNNTELLDNAPRIAHLPTEMVVGRYDCCCTPENSYDLATRLPNAVLTVVPSGGHSSNEPAMRQEVARAPARLRARILQGK